MDHKHLTAKEICSIIDKCGKNGVSKILFHELQLEFQTKQEKVELKTVNFELNDKVLSVEQEPNEKKQTREEFETLLEESKYLDPVLYERLSELDENTENFGT